MEGNGHKYQKNYQEGLKILLKIDSIQVTEALLEKVFNYFLFYCLF